MRFVIGLALALICSPALADDCALYKQLSPDDIVLYDATDQRLIATVERVRIASHTTEPFLVCEWTGPYAPIPMTLMFGEKRPGTSTFVVFMPRDMLQLSDESLAGVLGHEFGHTQNPLDRRALRMQKALNEDQHRQSERDADALSAQWMGYNASRKALDEAFGVIERWIMEVYAVKGPEYKAPAEEAIKTLRREQQDRVRAIEAWNKKHKKRG